MPRKAVVVLFKMALKAAFTAIKAQEHRSALVVASELASRLFKASRYEAAGINNDFNAEFLRWMLSDGAGALLLADRPQGTSFRIDWIHGFSHADAYPRQINDMLTDTFVNHDQELFRMFKDLGYWQPDELRLPLEHICWDHWQPLEVDSFKVEEKWTQVMDFESAHALFMCLFCFLLTREQYRDAINGFNLDQSMAIRIGQMIGEPGLSEMAYNKYPHYLVGPWNLGQRFLMHGFFTEYLYARLEVLRRMNL